MKIGIDLGHTLVGLGTGASALLKETDVNRAVGNLVIKYIKELGDTVVDCTVDRSVSDLEDRVSIANSSKVDVFVSLHCNAGGGQGSETYIYNGSYEGKEANRNMAKRVNDYLVSLGFRDRGVKEADYYVIKNTIAPAYLIELFFLDTQTDVDLYKKLGADKVARALAEGITGKKLPTTSTKKIYRVRKSRDDAASQIGAYSVLENAIAECKKHIGYSVYDETGKRVYPEDVPSIQNCDKEIKRYGENGICTITANSIRFRDKPCTCHGKHIANYYAKESVKYDLVVITEKYVWISWVGASTGTRRYMPITDRATGERWANCI